MLRLVALFLTVLGAKFATAAASSAECQGTECQDETSLVQVKASIKRHTDDEDDGPSGSKDVSLFFKNKEDLIAGLREAGNCLKDKTYATHDGFPKCKLSSGGTDGQGGICQNCIEEQWKDFKGTGYSCCKSMGKAEIEKAPLCGICLRNSKDGLKGSSGTKSDQSEFKDCAKYYCAATPSGGTDTAALQKIAEWCSPTKTANPTTPGFGLIGIVANNPKKQTLESFLEGSQVGALNKNITGTKSSSDMAQCITKGKKSSFATFSGPWGGDAQLAGLLAAQKVDPSLSSKPYIDALIFFNENTEAHKEDIASLVAVMKATMKPSDIAFTPSKATALITKLKSR